MPLTLNWHQIALRLILAAIASLCIGLNRDERGHSAGMRTTMLVCLAATLADLQMNLLLSTGGKTSSSFSVMDVMRLPLGILDGIGFIGAGVILKGKRGVRGVTTAATMWYVTVLGLLFGAGQIILGCVGTGLAVLILALLKRMERWIPRRRKASLAVSLAAGAPAEDDLREQIERGGCKISGWKSVYKPADRLARVECTLIWREKASKPPQTPPAIDDLRRLPGISSVVWEQ